MAAAAGLAAAEIPTAVDGCGVVTFALSLERMAAAFARLAELDGADRVLAAMRAHPELVGGEGSLDTDAHARRIRAGSRRAAPRVCSARSRRTAPAIALKSEDGSSRPLRAALAQLSRRGSRHRAGRELARRGRRRGGGSIPRTTRGLRREARARSGSSEPPKLQAPIELREYDPAWPALYEREAARIRAILGDRVVRLEHAGSTSVPALPAKPIIDIVLEVPDSADEAAYAPDLEAAGYVAHDPRARLVRAPRVQGPGHERQPPRLHGGLRGDGPDARCSATGCATNAADRERYAAAKRELAARDWTYVQQYADAKTAVVAEIMARAEAGASP